MAKVIITEKLEREVISIFKSESVEIFELMLTLSDNPKKGKDISCVGNIAVKEIKYKNYRFYFITDRFKVKFLKIEELKDLLIKFVRMSDKKTQQKVIDEIKRILINFGNDGFSQ